MIDPRLEAARLTEDPAHLRRKAAWIRARANEGPTRLVGPRSERARELEAIASRIEATQ